MLLAHDLSRPTGTLPRGEGGGGGDLKAFPFGEGVLLVTTR